MKIYAVFGVTPDPIYEFPAVLTARFWREVGGVEPYIALTGNEDGWLSRPSSSLVLQEIRNLGFSYVFVGSIKGCRDSTVAQNVRTHIAALPFDGDDYLITTDADLLPLSRDFCNMGDPTCKMTFWNSSCYNYSYHSLVHMGASASVWREVMDLGSGPFLGGLNAVLQRFVDKDVVPLTINKPKLSVKEIEWHRDELATSRNIMCKPWYPKECKMFDRNPAPGYPSTRIDRAAWPKEPSLEGKFDSHLLRPTHVSGNWERVLPLIKLCLPALYEWASSYRHAYLLALGG